MDELNRRDLAWLMGTVTLAGATAEGQTGAPAGAAPRPMYGRRVLLVMCLGTGAITGAASAQNIRMRGEVVNTGETWRYQIENLSSTSIVAYRVSSHCYGSKGAIRDFSFYHDAVARYGEQTPILPGATDSFPIFAEAAKCGQVTSAALYADGTSSGDGIELAAIRDRRKGVLVGLEVAEPIADLVAKRGAGLDEEATALDRQLLTINQQYGLNSTEVQGAWYSLQVVASLLRGETRYQVPPASAEAQDRMAKLVASGLSKPVARGQVIDEWLREWVSTLKEKAT
jgi:hypothetical protein